jgi:nitrite reductase (NO-forming)
MLDIFDFIKYLLFQGLGLAIAFGVAAIALFLILHRLHSRLTAVFLFLFLLGIFLFFYVPFGLPDKMAYPFNLKTYGPADGPWLPLASVIAFFQHIDQFERVTDIARNPADMPHSPTLPGPDGIVDLNLTAREVIAETAPGVTVNYWTFDGTVPGPMLRVREGDRVRVTLTNDPTSLHPHSIDLHAVTGPGGGAVATDVLPGQSKSFIFTAQNPGLFVYHCASPNAANHMAHGMYGMILVEPSGGLPPVDREFYVMEGELYTAGKMGSKGLQVLDATKLLSGDPEYYLLNGRVGGVNGKMEAKTGERVRLYFGNGGVNAVSSLHLIGEVFDTVYPEASMGGALFHNVQTTLVPAGGATITEFGLEVPGRYTLVDHALARIDRGAWGTLEVTGEPKPGVFEGEYDVQAASVHGH